MTLPTTIRSGIGGDDDGQLLPHDKHKLMLLSASTQAMLVTAIEVASELCRHDGRKEVSGDDTIQALIYVAQYFFDDPRVQNHLQQFMIEELDGRHFIDVVRGRTAFDDGSDSDSVGSTCSSIESSSDEIEKEEYQKTEDLAAVRRLGMKDGEKCGCDSCVKVRHAQVTWKDWKPSDEIETSMYQAVLRAEKEGLPK